MNFHKLKFFSNFQFTKSGIIFLRNIKHKNKSFLGMAQNFYDTLLHEFGNEDLNDVYLAEGLNERLISVVPLEKNEEVINSCDADKFME